MSTIQYSDGTQIDFSGNPTQQDIEEAYNQIKGIKTNPVIQSMPNENINENSATFKATPNEGIISGAAKLIGNIPSSAFNFAKGIVSSLNPYNVGQTISQIPNEFQHLVQESGGVGNALKAGANEFLPTLYGQLVPKATQQVLSGNFGEARQTLTNDPVGQILPYLLAGKAAAEKAGFGSQYDNVISKIASPVTKTGGLISRGTGALASETLGKLTGAGSQSIKEAFNPNNQEAFTKALRGETSPEDVVKTAQDALSNIAEKRRSEYLSEFQKIGENNKSLDISPVYKTLDTQLSNYGIKVMPDGNLDFSRSSIANSGTARADIQGVYNTLKDWGIQPGDRTPIGLDTLKKQLGDFYSQSNSARAFVQSVKSEVGGILKDQVPNYENMTSKYAETTKLLNDIKSTTSVGGRAGIDTVFTKLTSALKGDKQLRLDMLKELQSQGSQPNLMSQIAGINLQKILPKGFTGTALDLSGGIALLTHFFNPQFIPALLATSPRIVGEFVRALGIGKESVKPIVDTLNNIHTKIPSAINEYGKNPQLGLSIKSITPESVAKKIDATDIKLIKNYLNNNDVNTYIETAPMFKAMGIYGMDEPTLQRFLKEVIDLTKK